MKKPMIRIAMMAVALTLPAVAAAQTAQTYPNRPIRVVVPGAAGGPTDLTARLVGERLSQALGQPVVVENRAGGAMMIGTNSVAKSDPDGYTLLWTSSSPIVMVPAITKNVPYDVEGELVTVSNVMSTPLALYVANSTPASNVKELLEIVRKQPERANYGSAGAGTSVHILTEIMLKQTGATMVHVPYKGIAPQLQDLTAGQILLGGGDIGSAAGLLEGGQIRPIAVSGSKRSTILPNVPTFAEQGIPGLEIMSPWFGLLAPKGTPRAIVDKLSVEVQKIAKTREFADKLATLGLEPTGLLSDAADRVTRDDLARWKEIIANSGIKFD